MSVGPEALHGSTSPLPPEADQLWEVNSKWWQEAFTDGADAEYEEQIIPLLREFLIEARPARVLDIGCGEGQLSRVAAGVPGVDEVVGLDPTRSQLQAAVERQPGCTGGSQGGAGARAATVRPQYLRGTAGSLPFGSESFDCAFACLVFEHIEGTAEALAEVGRVLRPGAGFALLLNHPLLQAPGSGWVDDHILGEQYWRIGPYLAEHHAVEEVDKDVWIPFVHRPLSVYVNAMIAAGLYVTRMVEPPPPAGFLARADEYQQAAAFPRLLMLQARKLGGL
ncbi:MAG TPA: class I SAM-dependent methyltransferase [Acidimicrobiales bacterium]|nr:class I SAM-dependent methyltransferase [Acidimicrobiales bacterium]